MNNKKGIKNIFELIMAIAAVLALLNLDSIVNFIRNRINKRRMITIKFPKENSNNNDDELTEVPLFIKVLTSKFEDHSINDLVDVSYYNKSSDSELLDPIFSTPITSTSRIKGGVFYCKKDLPVIITINNFIAQNTNREFSPNLNLVISKTNKNGFDDNITIPFNKNPYISMIGFCAHGNLVDIDFLLDMESIFETEINDEETITSIDINVNLDCDV